MGISPEKFSVRLVALLPELMKEFSRYENNYVTRGHITCQQFGALDLIAKQDTWKMKDFVKTTGLGFSSVTGMVDRLVKLGLVKRAAGKEDRRTVWICVTAKGRKIIEEVYTQKKEGFAQVFKRLSAKERQDYLDILEKLVNNLSSVKGDTL